MFKKILMSNKIILNKIHDYLYEIPRSGNMLVPARIYISEKMIDNSLYRDEALKQVINVAHLPGIQKYSLAMPDIHWGYGFPIGGVAATDINNGVISPGGVGYDINCGIRIATTSLKLTDVKNKIEKLISTLFEAIPTGVGAHGAIKKLTKKELNNLTTKGSKWAVENGFGNENDLLHTEENGCLQNANPDAVSERAIERGLDQLGTLGSGNHFLEIDVVDKIYDEKTAEVFGLFENQIVVMIHTGSRGFGYQICDDYLKLLIKNEKKFGFSLPDRQLTCAPIKSVEGRNYFSAMNCAANFAWNNRQIIMDIVRKNFIKMFSISHASIDFRLLYDISHNIAKIEKHEIDGKIQTLCVHRKGATRAFSSDNEFIPPKFNDVGQPVLIPGDMGRHSFICCGSKNAMTETFGSSCHGAGRLQSRNQALKEAKGRNLIKELKDIGILILSNQKSTIAEEMPSAYKDVSDVVEVMHNAGISPKVARLKPIGVIKG